MSLLLYPPDMDDLMSSLATLVSQYGYAAVEGELRMHAPPVASAPARPTDPETSHLAAKHERDLGRFSKRSRQAKLLYQFTFGDWTDQHAAMKVVGRLAPVSALEGCRRRMTDLRAVGYLTDSGARAKNEGSNDESIIWRITRTGMRAIHNLNTLGWSRP